MTDSSILTEALSASVSGFVAAGTLYPLEVVKTKAQAASSSDDDDAPSDGWSVARSVYYSGDGAGSLRPFYDGVGTSAVQSAVEKGLYFLWYSAFKAGYRRERKGDIGAAANLALGCAAEWAHLPLTLPIDCVTTRIQTSPSSSLSPLSVLSALLSERGLAGLYRGWQAYVVLCLKPAIQYTVYERVKRIALARRRRNGGRGRSLSSAEAFALGLVARTVSTVAVFPYTRCKVLLQSRQKKGGAEEGAEEGTEREPSTIPEMLRDMYRREGLGSLYRGIGPELTRGVLSTALMLMVKERIEEGVAKAVKGV